MRVKKKWNSEKTSVKSQKTDTLHMEDGCEFKFSQEMAAYRNIWKRS
jgi:hypothetical protein